MVAVVAAPIEQPETWSPRPRLRLVDTGPAERSRRRRGVFWRRRLVAAALCFTAVFGAWLAVDATLGWIGGGPLTAAGPPGGLEPAAARVWVVRPGDTVWSIAEAIGGSGDVRPLVDRLSDEVGGRPLQPGQRLVLPGR